MMVCKEQEAYEMMNKEQQRAYIRMRIQSYKTHKQNAAIAVKEGKWTTATIHEENAEADLASLKALLSPVMLRDACEEALK
ncbi:MAG: hypothetical protein PHH85_09060 [Candidatus Methanoperedens sp.]|nr:hypothetical protein [Candidatus Methanoperedens sp.]